MAAAAFLAAAEAEAECARSTWRAWSLRKEWQFVRLQALYTGTRERGLAEFGRHSAVEDMREGAYAARGKIHYPSVS